MDLSKQWPYIEHVARERLRNNITVRHVDWYGTDIEVMGAAGELAARRFFAVPEHLHTHFDGGVDIRIEGWRIDVKTTKLDPHHRYLQWPHWKRVKADFVLLTQVDLESRRALVVGFATRDDILNAPVNISEARTTPCHEIAIQELRKPSELYAILSTPKRKDRPWRKASAQSPAQS